MSDGTVDSKKLGILSFIAIAIVLIGVALFIKFKPTDPVGEEYQPTLQETKDLLLGESAFPSAENGPLRIIKENVLPAGLRNLVPPDAFSIVMKEGSTEAGKRVYTVGFVMESPLSLAHGALRDRLSKQAGFTITRAARANLFSVIEAENPEYSVRANLTAKESITDVVLEILQK